MCIRDRVQIVMKPYEVVEAEFHRFGRYLIHDQVQGFQGCLLKR